MSQSLETSEAVGSEMEKNAAAVVASSQAKTHLSEEVLLALLAVDEPLDRDECSKHEKWCH